MKVLVATQETQGTVEGDFFFGTEGELVHLPLFVCHPWDGPCGCGRSFCGVESHRASSSAIVADRPDLEEGDVRRLVAASIARGGWGDDPSLTEICLDPTFDVADALGVGTVVGFRVEGSDNDPTPPEQHFYLRRLEPGLSVEEAVQLLSRVEAQ